MFAFHHRLNNVVGNDDNDIPTTLANAPCRRSSSIKSRPQHSSRQFSSSCRTTNDLADIPLGIHYQLQAQDVLVGKGSPGRSSAKHSGNLRLRVLAELRLSEYQRWETRRRDLQIRLIADIVDCVRSSGGNFVKYHDDGMWVQVSQVQAMRVTSGLFRALATRALKRQSLKKAELATKASQSMARKSLRKAEQIQRGSPPSAASCSTEDAFNGRSSVGSRRIGHVLLRQTYRPNYAVLFGQS